MAVLYNFILGVFCLVFLTMVMSNTCLIHINNYIPYISLQLVGKDIES